MKEFALFILTLFIGNLLATGSVDSLDGGLLFNLYWGTVLIIGLLPAIRKIFFGSDKDYSDTAKKDVVVEDSNGDVYVGGRSKGDGMFLLDFVKGFFGSAITIGLFLASYNGVMEGYAVPVIINFGTFLVITILLGFIYSYSRNK